jgi:hypothetical protein
MADKARYPQIPSTVWWGVRNILQRTPNATIDERLLGVQLGVQETAARAYVNELRHVGILTEEGRASSLAARWRLDDSYPEAVKEIIERAYPEGLIHVAPPGDADRQKVVSWFLREGLGQGAAGNKAATYILMGSPIPNEAPTRVAQKETNGAASRKKAAAQREPAHAKAVIKPEDHSGGAGKVAHRSEVMPLNINVQIHIGADAGTDQIETIFKAMKRYLYDASAA